MQTTAIGKKAKIKTETEAGPAVPQDDSVDLAALPRRQSSARLARRNLRWEGRRGFSIFGLIWYHFARGGKECSMERPKPFLHMHLRRAVDADLGGGAGREPHRGDSGPKSGRRAEDGGGSAEGREPEDGGRESGRRRQRGAKGAAIGERIVEPDLHGWEDH